MPGAATRFTHLLIAIGLAAAAWLPATEAHGQPPDESRFVVRPGSEEEVMGLLGEPGVGDPLEGGYTFDRVSIDRSRIVFGLRREGASEDDPPVGRVVLSPRDTAEPDQRVTESFAVAVAADAEDPRVREHLLAAADRIAEHDRGHIYDERSGPEDRGVPPPVPTLPAWPLALVLLALAVGTWWLGRARPGVEDPRLQRPPPEGAVRLSPLEVPGYLLLGWIVLATLLGHLFPHAWPVAATVALAATVLALGWTGLVRLRRHPSPSQDLVVAAAVLGAALPTLAWLLLDIHGDPLCHHGYTEQILRQGLPVRSPGDLTRPSAYHFGFDILAAGVHRLLDPEALEASLDLTSLLCLWVLGLAAAGVAEHWDVPPRVRAMAVLSLMLGTGPLYLATVWPELAPGTADWAVRWHGGTFMSVPELADRRPAMLGAVILVLSLGLVRKGALTAGPLATPRGGWAVGLLGGTLFAAASLSADDQVAVIGLLGLGGILVARRAALRGLLRPLAIVGILAVVVALTGGFTSTFVAHLLGASPAPPGEAVGVGPGLRFHVPGFPSFVAPPPHVFLAPSSGFWKVLLLEFGPALLLTPLLLVRRTGTPRWYAAPALLMMSVMLLAGTTVSLPGFGYDVDMHRLTVATGWAALLHAPLLVWQALRRRPLVADAAACTLLLVTLVGPIGFTLRRTDSTPVVYAAVAAGALLLLGLHARRRPEAASRWMHAALAGLALLFAWATVRAAVEAPHHPKPDLRAVAVVEDILAGGGASEPVLANTYVSNVLMARGYRVVAPHLRSDLDEIHHVRHERFLDQLEPRVLERFRPGVFVLAEEQVRALREPAARAGYDLEIVEVFEPDDRSVMPFVEARFERLVAGRLVPID